MWSDSPRPTMQLKMLLMVVFTVFASVVLAVPTAIVALNTTAPFLDYRNNHQRRLSPNALFGSVVMPDGTIMDTNGTGKRTVDADQPQVTLVITMGTKRQHAGLTVSRDIAKEVGQALDWLCDSRSLQIPGRLCRPDVESILTGIRYNAGTNSALRVRIDSDYIPNAPGANDNAAILTLFQDQIVQAFRAAINCDKNRYVLWKAYPAPTSPFVTAYYECLEMANTADWYQVALWGLPGDGPQPHLRVATNFNGITDEGQFDCIGTLTNVWGTIDDHRIKHTYAQALGLPVGVAIDCGDHGEPGWPDGHCGKPKEAVHCVNDRPPRLGCRKVIN